MFQSMFGSVGTKKTRALNKLMAEFPWMFAICDTYQLLSSCPLPKIKRAPEEIFTVSIKSDQEWWAVFAGYSKQAPVVGVRQLPPIDLPLWNRVRGLRAFLDVGTVLFLVSRDDASVPQQFTIYKPPNGRNNFGFIPE